MKILGVFFQKANGYGFKNKIDSVIHFLNSLSFCKRREERNRMKNKILFFIVSCLLSLAVGLFGTFLYFQGEENNNMELSDKQGTLFIKDCQVENTNVIVYKDYAILPFLKILSAFDYKIQWVSDTEVNITNSHGAYILNIKEKNAVRRKSYSL